MVIIGARTGGNALVYYWMDGLLND